jgi:2-desacetyl-2-hydroxyethyl bacteriochlorophyllide A dehydrogenase
VRSRLTTISHGTEMSLYRGTAPFATQAFELERRAFVPHEAGTIYPMQLGTEYVGEVTAIGDGVDEVAVGDVVYGRGGHKEVQQSKASDLVLLPESLDSEAALFVHHGCVALNALHDAKMRLGDSIAVIGLGVIGLLTVQMARLSGARRVFAADTFAMRRDLASEYGAEEVFDPLTEDAGLEIKSRVGAGVDVAFEVSGTYAGLQAAIRSVRIGGRIVAVGYYQGGGEALRLGEEFLHNRVDVVATMYVWDCPHRDYPLWDKARLQNAVFELLASGALSTESLITHRIPWQEADSAYRLLDEHPDETVRVAITYD